MVLYIVESAYVVLCCDIKIVCEYIKTFVKEIRFWQNFKFPGLWMKVEIKIWADSSALPLSHCCYCCQSSDMLIPGAHNTATVSGKWWQWLSSSNLQFYVLIVLQNYQNQVINQLSKNGNFHAMSASHNFCYKLQTTQSCNCNGFPDYRFDTAMCLHSWWPGHQYTASWHCP